MLNRTIKLSYEELGEIVKQANRAGINNHYIEELVLIPPVSACYRGWSYGWVYYQHRTASDSIPECVVIKVIE